MATEDHGYLDDAETHVLLGEMVMKLRERLDGAVVRAVVGSGVRATASIPLKINDAAYNLILERVPAE